MLALSPLTRRLLALGLLLLAVLLAVQLVIAPLLNLISDERARLHHAEARAARLEAALAWGEVPGVPAALQRALLPPGNDAAVAALENLMTGAAARHALELAVTDLPTPATAAPLRASLSVSGAHDDVLAFLAALENGPPVLRITALDLAPASQATGSLTAQLSVEAVRRHQP